MIKRTGELYPPRRAVFETSPGVLPSDAHEERLKFVKKMKWFPGDHDDDRDRYDAREDTYHFVRRDEHGEVLASMRLTPIESVEESLSFEMIAANESFQEAVRANEGKIADGDMWDLTRLVFPLENHASEDIHKAIIELFGMAARESAGRIEDPARNVSWIFSTTPWVLRFFEQTGIKSETLAQGALEDVSGKSRTTFFCAVDVAAAIEYLRTSDKHKDTYVHLCIGADEVIEAEAA